MTRATYQALKRYILKEREKKKQGLCLRCLYGILALCDDLHKLMSYVVCSFVRSSIYSENG